MSQAKDNAAAAALDFIEDGMTVGLGSGSTAEIFVELLGEKVAGGLKVRGVPTSNRTAAVAQENGVPLIDIDRVSRIDLTVDGADEVDPLFSLVKGGGGFLLREKIVAFASDRMVTIVDSSKLVEKLGAFPLPVEVDPFGVTLTAEHIYDALQASHCENGQTVLRQAKDGSGPYRTDGGHFIVDCKCGVIPDPGHTAMLLQRIPGVMEHGLFIDIADVVIVGEEDHARVMELSREKI